MLHLIRLVVLSLRQNHSHALRLIEKETWISCFYRFNHLAVRAEENRGGLGNDVARSVQQQFPKFQFGLRYFSVELVDRSAANRIADVRSNKERGR